MSAQHTPGPWKVRKHWSGDGTYEVYPTRGGKPKFGEWLAIAEVTDAVSKGESAKANARLIAAAPDMLAALIVARSTLATALISAAPGLFATEQDIADHLAIKQIDAAIQKATGGAA